MNKPIFDFNEETGLSTYTIVTKHGRTYTGTAKRHPEDEDMSSKLTGMSIAEMRAQINAFKDIRDNELIPELRSLNHLSNNIRHSSKFNPKSYENVMLQRQIRQRQNSINDINELIDLRKTELKEFLYEKEKCYQAIRKHRAEAAHEQGQEKAK